MVFPLVGWLGARGRGKGQIKRGAIRQEGKGTGRWQRLGTRFHSQTLNCIPENGSYGVGYCIEAGFRSTPDYKCLFSGL